jgi:hypothetical protein|tara:strand:- start:324 stop:884 length:561 start_codon:yes stop_codon:yes gene_type:complete
MGQSRSKTGVDFEKKICEAKGWTHKSASPRINWTGTGRSNWNKIVQAGFDPTNFIPNMDKSVFDKYDAITEKGEKVEIKKYNSTKLSSWTMFSEPVFKVATRSALKTVTNKFGEGDFDSSVEVYNTFVDGIIPHVGDEILNNITRSNIGVQCEDRFIPQSELEYRWKVKSGWKGYNRLSIEFRVKS